MNFSLTNFISVRQYPQKKFQNQGFLIISGGTERDQWHEMGYYFISKLNLFDKYAKFSENAYQGVRNVSFLENFAYALNE